MARMQRAKEKFVEEKGFEYDLDCKDKNSCKAKVTNESHCMCSNTHIKPKANIHVKGESVVVKIPVVLAETSITIPVVSKIKLEEKAMEIKRIKKNVYIKQCHLIPGTISKCHPCTGLLNIEGFVRKNIEYATKDCTGKGVTSGRIHHTTVEVPFSCTTKVRFTVSPVFIPNVGPVETEMFQDKLKGCDICGERIMGNDPCERNFEQVEFFNERVYCELVSATIFESDIDYYPEAEGCDRPTELLFDEFIEKMVVCVTLKLLQNQQVCVESIEECCDDFDFKDE